MVDGNRWRIRGAAASKPAMRLLVTGGCGFVGSNFIRYILEHYGPEMVTNVDALTTGHLRNVADLAGKWGERYEFLHASVGDSDRIETLLAQHQYFAVIHFAGESCSASETGSLLARARRHGVRRFLCVSSDEATVARQECEQVALEALRNHGQEVVITRATGNYGPFQALSGFVPNTIGHALRGEPAPVPGDGSLMRDWLHVEDHCAALFTALLDGQPGAIYRIAAGHELRDLDLVRRILEQLGQSGDLVQFVPPLPKLNGAVDSIVSELPSWKPRHSLAQGLHETVDWYVHNQDWWKPLIER